MSTSAVEMRRRLNRQNAPSGLAGAARGAAQSAAGQTNPRTLPLPNQTASAPLRSDPNAFTRRGRFGPSATGAGAPTGLASVPNPTPVTTPAITSTTGASLESPATNRVQTAFTRRAAEISGGGVPDSYRYGGLAPTPAATQPVTQGLAQDAPASKASTTSAPITPQQIGDLQLAAIRAQNLGGARDPNSIRLAQQYLDGIGQYNTYAAANGLELMTPAPGILNLLQSGDVTPTQGPVPDPVWPSTPDPRFPPAPAPGDPLPPGYEQPVTPPLGGQTPLPTIPPIQEPEPTPGTGGGGGTVGGAVGGAVGGGGGTGGTGGGTGGGGTGGGGSGGFTYGTGGPPAILEAAQQDLTAPQEALGADVATYDPSLANLGPEATIEGRIENLFTEGNPLLARARAQGAEIANNRGLLNSSMGAQIGVAALMDQALNIAAPDAAAMQNAVFANQDAINSSLQYNTEAQNMVNRADQNFRQQWSSARQAFGEAGTLQRQGYQETLALQRDQRDNSMALLNQEYNRKGELEQQILQPAREALARIQGDYQLEVQNNASNMAAFTALMTGSSAILGNDRFNTETQRDMINGLAGMTRAAIELNADIAGFGDRIPAGGFGTDTAQQPDFTINNPDGSTTVIPSGQPVNLEEGQSFRIPGGALVRSVQSGSGGPTAPIGNTPSDQDTTVLNADGSIAYRQPFNAEIRLEPGQYFVTEAGVLITG